MRELTFTNVLSIVKVAQHVMNNVKIENVSYHICYYLRYVYVIGPKQQYGGRCILILYKNSRYMPEFPYIGIAGNDVIAGAYDISYFYNTFDILLRYVSLSHS